MLDKAMERFLSLSSIIHRWSWAQEYLPCHIIVSQLCQNACESSHLVLAVSSTHIKGTVSVSHPHPHPSHPWNGWNVSNKLGMILLLLFQAKSTTEANTWEVIPTLPISAKQDCGVRIRNNGLSRPLQKHIFQVTVRFISSPVSDIPDGWDNQRLILWRQCLGWMENFPWWPLTMQPTFLWITDSSEAKSIWQIADAPWLLSTLKSPLKITNTHSLS